MRTALSFRPQTDAMGPAPASLDFRLPPELEAGEPPEARGLDRDHVRLMVSYPETGRIVHARFKDLPGLLGAGDVLVVNTSGTRPAALDARRETGEILELRLSTRLPADLWVVELRRTGSQGSEPFFEASAGERLTLPAGGQASLLTPYRSDQRRPDPDLPRRLWIADLRLPSQPDLYLQNHGYPIRYKYVREAWPLEYYQTIFAEETGSAEMPSAGRAFSRRVLAYVERRGVLVAPVLLHTGVASLEEHEPPYEEYYRVPARTAQIVNRAWAAGQRVIAVGTTVTRALETAASETGQVTASEGWTDLVIDPERKLRAVSALLTGMHEPRSTHLSILVALAGLDHIQQAYSAALQEGYLWHEFGDLHLILP
jgi:S-adenosylmethionine:tRNA ribosyltransferase-isomerase